MVGWQVATTNDPVGAPFGHRLCTIQNFNLMDTTSLGMTFLCFFALSIGWEIQAKKERLEDRVNHETRQQNQLDELAVSSPVPISPQLVNWTTGPSLIGPLLGTVLLNESA